MSGTFCSSSPVRRAHGHRPRGDFPFGGADAREHGREDEQVHELWVEGRAAAFEDDVAGDLGGASAAVAAVVGDGVEGVGDRDDAGRHRDASSLELAGIAGAVPPLVVREHAGGELRVEAVQGCEHVGTTLGVREDRSALGGGELAVVVDDVEERLVDLADVVKERDTLDDALVAVAQSGGVGEDEGVVGDAADVGAGLGVVGVDGVEERFEGGGGEPLGALPAGVLALDEQDARDPCGDGAGGCDG